MYIDFLPFHFSALVYTHSLNHLFKFILCPATNKGSTNSLLLYKPYMSRIVEYIQRDLCYKLQQCHHCSIYHGKDNSGTKNYAFLQYEKQPHCETVNWFLMRLVYTKTCYWGAYIQLQDIRCSPCDSQRKTASSKLLDGFGVGWVKDFQSQSFVSQARTPPS